MTRSRSTALTLAGFLFIVFVPQAAAQGTYQDYVRAERFLASNLDSLVLNESITSRWVGETDSLWYRREEAGGGRFLLVDPVAGTRGPAFDHERLAEALSTATDSSYDGRNLPFRTFSFTEDRGAIRFQVRRTSWECDLSSYTCNTSERGERGGYRNGRSPDGRWEAFARDHNLYVRDLKSGEEIQLTDDGRADYDYAQALASPVDMIRQGRQDVERPLRVRWSPDSQRLVTFRLDSRSARRYGVYQSVPDDQIRPKFFTYVYPVPGETGVPFAEPVVFDVRQREQVQVDMPAIPILYTTGAPLLSWSNDGERLYYAYTSRGYKQKRLLEIDPRTGESRTMVEETADTHVDPHMSHYRFIDEGKEVLWSSERDGWHHLYLYDGATGALVNQVTRGPWVVREIHRIDAEQRQVYFTAGGREAGRDPYLRHLYRIDLDGSDLTLLTPEAADHDVSFSPSGDFFLDTYSRVDMPPVTVLRSSRDGGVVQELERADVSRLLATGWRFPEPFHGKGSDGETDIYGVMWRPSTFDSTGSYPVVEQVYTGPHDFHVPKTFNAFRSTAQSIAELGFITVMIDGMGTGRRSRAFGDVSYENLGGGGIEDHIAVLRQLAERYPQLDLSRVGIYGHSAGGYDAAHALLTHPDFYKAAVSSAGNHDHRLDKAWWTELWMGSEIGEHYEKQSNPALADRLEGKLLLIHGEVDENVHPSSTLRLADALIEANKDFDMFIMPNGTHGIGRHPYFIRKRWDYFVEHLLGKEPPSYRIGAEKADREEAQTSASRP